MTASILVTGGAGFIGTHVFVALRRAGYRVVIVDDFSNSCPSALMSLRALTGAPVPVHRVDVADEAALENVFASQAFDAVVHLAAKKSVPQSLAQPQRFFDANTVGLLTLLKVMDRFGVRRIVYSSSATVYGRPEALPIPEHAPLSYTNPYGLSKLVGEQFLNQRSRLGWSVGILRYFNPVGAHPSGLIGERPRSDGGNLMPIVSAVARGVLPHVDVFGHDYGTPDGTGIRDFVHVCDVAEGHAMSLARLLQRGRSHTVNLGKGRGYSVLEVIKTYEAVSGRCVPYRLLNRRPGDVAASFADTTMAQAVLGFRAKRDLTDMCKTSWAWETARPSGREGTGSDGMTVPAYAAMSDERMRRSA